MKLIKYKTFQDIQFNYADREPIEDQYFKLNFDNCYGISIKHTSGSVGNNTFELAVLLNNKVLKNGLIASFYENLSKDEV
jgi:hypothetical protein